jgi:SET domain-containing protein
MSKQPNWGTRWLTLKAKVINSKIHGLGVQATKPIKKGEVVGVLGGLIVPKKEVKKYWNSQGHVGIQISDGFFIVPPNRAELKKYGVYNHSCNPNIGFGNESIILYAIKNIREGEELVFDYAFCELVKPPFKCKCGFKGCRKVIRSTDWKIKKLQNKYYRYFAPFIKAKIIT